MRQRVFSDGDPLAGYDAHSWSLTNQQPLESPITFSPSEAYNAYFKIRKFFVNQPSATLLIDIATRLENERLPDYLDVSAWAFVEAALVAQNAPASERVVLIERAVACWQQALVGQDKLMEAGLTESTESYRHARSLAFMPLVESLIVGNVTKATREKRFADLLAITQASLVQSKLAEYEANYEAGSDHRGFQYENIALLSVLFVDDPRYICLPSTARAGSGRDYPDQTHDMVVLQQEWGTIATITPIEIKASASLRDLMRYKALIIRGKMHLCAENLYNPLHTIEAFASAYACTATPAESKIVHQVTSKMRALVDLYVADQHQSDDNSTLQYHQRELLEKKFREFSLQRASTAEQ